ncbi:MAG: ATP-grasp domain-containing protein [Planctomycetota bacterium]
MSPDWEFDPAANPANRLPLLSELYAQDAPESVLLAEYPSSNSDQTRFRNVDRYIIHDPFPPPRPELLKCLGPHHLMFGWGDRLAVTSQVRPPEALLDHWRDVLGDSAKPEWIEFDQLAADQEFVVLFPHETLKTDQQLVDPDDNYFLHSKQVIEQIECPQAEVFDTIQFPCIAKLSHGYAGLSNYVLRQPDDEIRMNATLAERWPTAKLVYNSIIEEIVEDVGVQFYLRRDGRPVWLGFTEQAFDQSGRWCGGRFSAERQAEMALKVFPEFIEPTAKYLSSRGYFGVVGIDILKNKSGDRFLVDVNPRLTGITPFLVASRILSADDFNLREGIYRASCRFQGSLDQLLARVKSVPDAKVVVLSAFDDRAAGQTICHLSVNAESQAKCDAVFGQLLDSTS